MQRPTGVSLIAILVGLGGAIGILAALFDLGLFGEATFYGGDRFLSATLSGYGLLGLSIIQLAIAYGLWKLIGWARGVTMIVLGVRFLNDLFALIGGGNLMAILFNMLISVIVLWYLVQPEIKDAFIKNEPVNE